MTRRWKSGTVNTWPCFLKPSLSSGIGPDTNLRKPPTTGAQRSTGGAPRGVANSRARSSNATARKAAAKSSQEGGSSIDTACEAQAATTSAEERATCAARDRYDNSG